MSTGQQQSCLFGEAASAADHRALTVRPRRRGRGAKPIVRDIETLPELNPVGRRVLKFRFIPSLV